jgi:hypothetical protein
MALTKVTPGMRTLGTDEVTADIIKDDAITNAEIKSDAAIAQSKLTEVTAGDLASTLDLSSKTVTLPEGTITPHVTAFDDNSVKEDVAVLGFKIATSESLAKYNLVDQTIDAFEDATGVDAGSSTGEARDASNYYSGKTTTSSTTGFTVTGGLQTFTVPAGVSSLEIKCWGASGNTADAGNGGFSKGNLSTSSGTQYAVVVGEVTADPHSNTYSDTPYGGGGRGYNQISGGGLSGVFTGTGAITFTSTTDQDRAIIIAGGGAGRGGFGNAQGGVGGGAGNPSSSTFNHPAANINTTDSAYHNQSYKTGSGGTQTSAGSYSGVNSGSVMKGGDGQTGNEDAGGGGGYYGGSGGTAAISGGGGSGYVGTQNGLSAGATYYAWDGSPSGTMTKKSDVDFPGDDVAKVLFKYDVVTENDMTLISNSTTAQAAPTKADFVMTYTDGAGTTTVNTDLKAYASRDDGTTWTQLTLASQGIVATHTILTAHDLDISGQPSGTAMKYKITTHNQSVTKETRVHAVSLGWS